MGFHNYSARIVSRPAGKDYKRVVVVEIEAQSESEARRKAIAKVQSEGAAVHRVDYCTRRQDPRDLHDMLTT